MAGGISAGTGSLSFPEGVTAQPYYWADVLVTRIANTPEIYPEWFGARQATTVSTDIGTKSWNAWPSWITGATYLATRSEEHTSELQSLMRISYAVFCLQKKQNNKTNQQKEQKAHRHSQ